MQGLVLLALNELTVAPCGRIDGAAIRTENAVHDRRPGLFCRASQVLTTREVEHSGEYTAYIYFCVYMFHLYVLYIWSIKRAS